MIVLILKFDMKFQFAISSPKYNLRKRKTKKFKKSQKMSKFSKKVKKKMKKNQFYVGVIIFDIIYQISQNPSNFFAIYILNGIDIFKTIEAIQFP
ncbi:hypothetical protein BpHYR1_049816 [Brachionus plicatilis]|uniref:Uncharacterized protein n=1 Tax=Brachionus plicatilis TaxID=10195 RepID=A0A3M7Q046_BRAPC|nr:hypothetical protein BpHYR1_049816 [Brachionus plicatilis]